MTVWLISMLKQKKNQSENAINIFICRMDITIKDIAEIHRRVLDHVDPLEGGGFRRTQVCTPGSRGLIGTYVTF